MYVRRSAGLSLAALFSSAAIWVPSAGAQKDTSADILRDLAHQDWRVRKAACDALGHSEENDPTVVAALCQRLTDPDSLVRRVAARALGRVGKAAAPAALKLVHVLDQDYVGVEASQALQSIGPQAIEALITAIRNRKEPFELRLAALAVLSDFGPQAKEAVNELVRLLKDSPQSPEMVIRVCQALGAIGSDAASAAPVLLRGCRHEDSLIRLEVARALGNIGPLPTSQIQPLIEAMEAEQKALALISAGQLDSRRRPLTSFGGKTQREVQDDEHRSAYVQMEFVFALEKLQAQWAWKEAESTVMPALVKVLEYLHTPGLGERWHKGSSPDSCLHCHLYIAACRALRFYGPSARNALPALENLLQYKLPRNEVRKTIKAIRPDCYLDPWVLSLAGGHAETKVVVRREEMVSDDGRHIIVVLRLRKNTRSREELQRIFPNAVHGWVRMKDEIKWGGPNDRPVAERVAKIPAKRTGDSWWADLTIPRIEHTTLHVWDTKWHDYSGYLHELALMWASPD